MKLRAHVKVKLFKMHSFPMGNTKSFEQLTSSIEIVLQCKVEVFKKEYSKLRFSAYLASTSTMVYDYIPLSKDFLLRELNKTFTSSLQLKK